MKANELKMLQFLEMGDVVCPRDDDVYYLYVLREGSIGRWNCYIEGIDKLAMREKLQYIPLSWYTKTFGMYFSSMVIEL